MSRRVVVVEDKRTDGWLVFIVAAALVVYGNQLILLGTLVVVLWALFTIAKYFDNRKLLKAIEAPMAIPVVDEESYNSIYGKYEPYTMPLTYPIVDTFPYRNEQMRGKK
jgi:hypothetical protein